MVSFTFLHVRGRKHKLLVVDREILFDKRCNFIHRINHNLWIKPILSVDNIGFFVSINCG